MVRDAFLRRGHDAYSCDVIAGESEPYIRHLRQDVREVIERAQWDLMIAHPPCTFMANSGAKHLYMGTKKVNGPDPQRWESMREGAEFFKALWNSDIPKIAVENPVMLGYAQEIIGAGPTQVIQPWMFGHAETKATCLWLKGLPALTPTKIMPKPHNPRVHFESPGPNRWKNRSRTLHGIAKAMADQWG